ncbi:hypothetical protein NP493_723g02006 [Ridgeia piscesae]|uniref:Fucolectin tachylectin-4 pentraxin-1 domain-containing protein n=1 Tax=Ridgeia piscesae TaxID=27915 RepID=A0AAD9KQC2_RIDPI|nr:hypothetical protein NP493_723g02006 [Ridgeia piscesae]
MSAYDRSFTVRRCLGRRHGDMAKFFLVVLFLTIVAHQRVLGAHCRFARTSANQGSCVFPCRCTDACNTTTGDCLNDGRCEDGHPSGYRWTGPGCQTGNIAYQKNASQVIGSDYAKRWPAERAVDGNPDPDMTHGYCAHPETDWYHKAWWTVDLGDTYTISKVTIYNRGDYSEYE